MLSQSEINQQEISSDHVMHDLGASAAKGGVIAVAAQPLRILVQFTSTALMARLLAPADFGLVAMAMAITGFVSIFTELNLGAATVQRKTIDQDLVSGLLLISIGTSIALMPLTWLAAPVAAWFFGDDRVVGLIVALSITLPLTAAGAQHAALLMRNMRWLALQWAGLAGLMAGSLAGVLAAWTTDLGYWSLVINAYVGNLVSLALIWKACRWRPTRVQDWSSPRSALAFGLHLTGFGFVNFFHRQLDNVLIGWRYGPAELGLYSRAYQLMLLPITVFNNALSSALEPTLSRLQHEPQRWRRAFLDALALTAFLGSGMAAVLIAGSTPLIAVLYGPQWTEAAVIFQWLAVSSFAGVPMSATGWIYVSLGQTRRMLVWSLLFAPVMAAAFVIALPYGAVGVAIAYAIITNLALIPAFWFAARGTPVRTWDTIQVILPMAFAGAVAAWVGKTVPVEHLSTFLQLIVQSGATGLLYFALAGALVLRMNAFEELRQRFRTFASRLHLAFLTWRDSPSRG